MANKRRARSKLVRMVFNNGDALAYLDHDAKLPIPCKCLKELAGTTGLEPAASAVTGVIETVTY